MGCGRYYVESCTRVVGWKNAWCLNISRGPSNQLSSRASGHKRCLADKEYCRVEKCISRRRLRTFKDVVVSRGPSNQLSSRTSGHKHCRVVRVDRSVVESTKNIVEWKNASH